MTCCPKQLNEPNERNKHKKLQMITDLVREVDQFYLFLGVTFLVLGTLPVHLRQMVLFCWPAWSQVQNCCSGRRIP